MNVKAKTKATRKQPKREAAPSLFLSDLPNPRDEQFRMRRLQVLNWGTFSGLVDVPIAERGFLFVGRSGSGKSTLLDAMSALLVPPNLVDFNAAAREAERSGRDRSLISYVRGAWADQHDGESGEIATQYLRKGSTWSALVLEYRNAMGETVSLIRLFWVAGNSSATADVKKHYMVCERAFDVAAELQGFDLDLRRLKARLGEDVHHFDTFAAYAERFRRLLGIQNEMALKLLHKTQSAKNLGDLNTFLRSFMLDEPETFGAANRLVTDFGELDAAHKAVVIAREQVDTLAPARSGHESLQTLRRQTSTLRELHLCVDTWREQRRLVLVDERLAEMKVRDVALEGEIAQRRQTVENHDRRVADLEQQRREQGGDLIDQLEREHEKLSRERDERMKRRDKAERACAALSWNVPSTAQGFAEIVGRSRELLDSARERAAGFEDRMDALKRERDHVTQRFAGVRAEIEALKRNPSNIPGPIQAMRARLCEALGCSENTLPFVGELLQVKPEHAAWRGAIERVLHGFALSLLVDERHYAEVSSWINKTHLGGKLVYYRVGRIDALDNRAPGSRSLVQRLDIHDHAHREWVARELARRFDYACVDSAAALRNADRAITREGLVKHGGDRHEKDDRRAVDDRRNWVLGFDNRDKLSLFEREGHELAQAIAHHATELDKVKAARDADGDHRLAASQLVNLEWEEIDVAPKLRRLGDIDDQLQQLRAGDTSLQGIMRQLDSERIARSRAAKTLEDASAERLSLERERNGFVRQRESCLPLAHALTLSTTQMAALAARLPQHPALVLDNLDRQINHVKDGLNLALAEHAQQDNALVQTIEECLRTFCRKWPQDSTDFTPGMESVDGFTARLRRLELDGLPKHEARFFDLLQSQSKQNLLVLQKHMIEARKSIGQRMEEVNESLEQVPFNRGTILQIELTDRNLPEVRDFQLQLREVLSQHQTEDRERAEAQFAVLRQLVTKLAADDPEHKRWREQVLDVRQHVEFVGVEKDAGSLATVEVYRSGAGKSGGQRQKLATTCLAAALRYQLGGDDGHLPRYAPVVLDEAFDKADNEFTALAMNIFENFGFQMVVATPLKSVMTLEPFIGGACFVDISGRHDSGVLLIEYDEDNKRLALPEKARQAEAQA
ncbi:ATP-binding protein [Dyella monticola]|uniref:ATP-binding protein n=1 Tax=Dyella monticola TaxID=1927958 RepID=A0A370WRJ4_9GAMM|nr:SbcC/MukB-like Walker B domain-containing protein [Dyella monticola]RDS78768.1 ATP-binding protein [Dyella monticola]